MKITKEYLKANGGVTLTFKRQLAHNLKFVASQFGHEIKANFNAIDDDYLESTIKEYSKLAKRLNAFIGLWLNGDDLYIDLSYNFDSKENCLSMAKSNKQLAIFDAINKEVVSVI